MSDLQPFLFDHRIQGGNMGRIYTPITNPKLHAFSQSKIGLAGDAQHSVVRILNMILADEAVLTMKTRSAHWHVRGPGFLDMRNLFDQQFHQLNTISDHIAVRARMLGGVAIGSFKEFLDYTRLEEQPGEVPDIMNLLADHETSIRFLCEDARKCLEEYQDHGTYALLVRFIRLHEKMASILRSYIEPEMTRDESQGNNMQPTLR